MSKFKRYCSSASEEWKEMQTKPLTLLSWFLGIISVLSTPMLTLFKVVDARISILVETALLVLMFFKYYRLKFNTIELKYLYNGNVPMVAALSYIMNRRERTLFNRMTMNTVSITYQFTKVSESEEVLQKVIWRFNGTNETGNKVTKAPMMISKSVFTSYCNIKISAIDLRTKKKLGIEFIETSGSQKFIYIIFGEEGILNGQSFDYQLTMCWEKPVKFSTTEFFILDPQNYSLKTNNINVNIESNHELLKNSLVTFLKMNQQAVTYKNDEYNGKLEETDGANYQFSRSFRAESGKLYLIRIDRNQNGL